MNLPEVRRKGGEDSLGGGIVGHQRRTIPLSATAAHPHGDTGGARVFLPGPGFLSFRRGRTGLHFLQQPRAHRFVFARVAVAKDLPAFRPAAASLATGTACSQLSLARILRSPVGVSRASDPLPRSRPSSSRAGWRTFDRNFSSCILPTSRTISPSARSRFRRSVSCLASSRARTGSLSSSRA